MRDIRERLRQALNEPDQNVGRFFRFFLVQIILFRFCFRRLQEHNLLAMAAALAYQTIFAMIPVLVLALLVMRTVGALDNSRNSLRKFLQASGFSQIVAVQATETRPGGQTAPGPPSGKVINVADSIEDMVDKVSSKLTFERIGPVGGALLIWTALTLMTTMEQSLNRVFGARGDRPIVRRILLYWSTMTLGPIALASASYLGNQAMRVVERAPGSAWGLAVIGWIGPMVVGIIVLGLVYALLPNTAVRWKAAFVAAAVAVPLWMVAKWGFALYVRHLVVKGNLYGVLGLLPLFMMWLYLSWCIFLFGAELAYATANLPQIRGGGQTDDTLLGPSDLLAASLAIARHYQAGKGPMTRDELTGSLNFTQEAVQWLIDRLDAADLLTQVDGKTQRAYLLSRPPNRVDVLEVLEIADPRAAGKPFTGRDEQLAAAVAGIQARTKSSLEGLTLADLLE